MYIAVCDDDRDELLRIAAVLEAYRQERGALVLFKTFQSPMELLSSAHEEGFSLYLLDVMMPEVNGIEVAREIRSFDTEAKLVFLTASPEFALQSYSVKAQDYLLKPIDMGKLFPILDMLLAQEQKPAEGISLKTKQGLVRILYSNLTFVEVNNKCVYFHLTSGAVREINAALSEFEAALLSRPEFIRVHRSYIVNLWQVSCLSPSGITTFTGKNIPISRLLYTKVRDTYEKQLFRKGEK